MTPHGSRTPFLPVVLLALLLGLVHAQAPLDQHLPVTRLALYASGVGYFQHEGVVSGDQELVLSVPKAQMDDLLQSLVLQDLGGGQIEAVRYSSQAPLSRLLDGFSLDLGGNPTLAQLLLQARGERVQLQGAAPVEGLLVSVEQQAQPDGPARTYLTLTTAAGLQRLVLDDYDSVRFLDPEVERQVQLALQTIAANRNDEAATVSLRFSGQGQRNVRVSYLREMPLWKSTYRLHIGPEGVGNLQGWAIVDNPTDLPLTGVQLSFIAGQPVSFVTDLYEPVWVTRPRVATSAAAGTVPGVDQRQLLMDAPAPAPRATAEAAAASAQLSGAGVSAAAAAVAGATSFAYYVDQPVSIGRNQSALVPIVVTNVTAQRLSLFDENVNVTHPLHAVRLVNDSGLQLAAGSVTLYDDGGFAGNARLPDLLPGDERLLAFAVDLELSVSQQSGPRQTGVTRASLQGGLLQVTETTRLDLQFTVAGQPATGRFLIVQGPPLQGYQIVSPSPVPFTADGRPRFGVALVGQDGEQPSDPSVPTHLVCLAGQPCLLEVVAERLDSQTISLTDLTPARVGLYLQNAQLTDEDRTTLQALAAVQSEQAALDRDLALVKGRVEAIFQEQERIRGNMGQLAHDSELYQRYVTELGAQEDELAQLRGQQATLQEQRAQLQQRLADLVRGVSH